jgi:HK97 family phage prohead protease
MKTFQAEAAAKIQCGLARKCDFEKLSLDDIKAIKSDNSITHYRFVERGARAAAPAEGDDRTFVHVASSENVDSMGDVIKVAGWDTTRQKTGKIPLQWGHDSYPVPMGLVVGTNKRAKLDDGTKCLEATSRFHEADVYGDSEWGKTVESIRTLVARGDLPGVSVGFVPKSYHWPDQEERDALSMTNYGIVFDEQELLELSVTPIPANSRANLKKSMTQMKEALASMVREGKIDKATADTLLAQLEPSEDLFMLRAQQLGRTIVPISKELPWIRGAPEAPASNEPATKTATELSPELAALITKTIQDATTQIVRDVRTQVHRDVFAGIREILEPLEDAITEAADELQDAATRLGIERKDSERAEDSTPSAPNGADAVSAASTGKSRETPTNPAQLEHGTRLLRALEATNGRADSANAHPRPGQAGGVQDGR